MTCIATSCKLYAYKYTYVAVDKVADKESIEIYIYVWMVLANRYHTT